MPLPSEISLDNKVAVVTGGSSGIGAATVRALAQAGARVAVGYNKGRERAEALIGELPGSGHRAIQLRLEDSATLRAAEVQVRKAYGRADILVNSAGFTKPIPHGDLDALDDATFDAVMTANVRGVFAMIRAMTPLMRETGDAVIVNISSISGFTGGGSSIVYCASKGALDTMTLSLARALAPQIRVVCVSPAAVATDFVAGRGRPQLEKIAQTTPLNRVMEAEEVALAVLACVTHLRGATGTRIVVDNGRHL
ncbi:MAG: SDR family oxidoreductase [Rhizobiales bacterium]|nr:SDR family oxidoreductase [Hyphomicrobiales bacterium]